MWSLNFFSSKRCYTNMATLICPGNANLIHLLKTVDGVSTCWALLFHLALCAISFSLEMRKLICRRNILVFSLYPKFFTVLPAFLFPALQRQQSQEHTIAFNSCRSEKNKNKTILSTMLSIVHCCLALCYILILKSYQWKCVSWGEELFHYSYSYQQIEYWKITKIRSTYLSNQITWIFIFIRGNLEVNTGHKLWQNKQGLSWLADGSYLKMNVEEMMSTVTSAK